MALQYDFVPGLDISALASVTQAQLLQMISQIAPLSNIGGIICQTATPDVASNPRFARYVWLDSNTSPPIAKVYNGAAWVSWSVGAAGITEAMIAAEAVKLASMKKSEATAYQIMRKNAANTAFEYVSPSQIIPTGQLEPSALNVSMLGATLMYLKKDNLGNVAFSDPNLADFPSTSKLPVINIANQGLGAYCAVLVHRFGAGNPEWLDSASDLLFGGNSIDLTKLGSTGSLNDGDLIQFDGATSFFVTKSPLEVIAAGVFTTVGAAFASTTLTHSLGVKPRFVKIFARCNAGGGDIGYAQYNDIPISTIVDVNQQPVGARITANTIEIIPPIAAGVITQLTTTNCGTGAVANMTHASWKWGCIVMK